MSLFALVIALLISTMGFSAAAEPAAEGKGYIVRLSDETVGDHGLVYAENEAELRSLLSENEVIYYEPNYSVELNWEANDAYYGQQWNLASILAPSAWDAGLFGEGVTVAVIDTGLYTAHEDFSGASILPGMNLIDGTSDVSDQIGHGTVVAGIIAAQMGNNLGIAGMADRVSIVPLRCFQYLDEADMMDICRGIYKAIDSYSSDVICMSLGSPMSSRALEEAVNYATASGAIIVAAAGNEGQTDKYYPASFENVISVASYGPDGEVSSFSERNDGVFVSAPGANIYSTYIGSSAAYASADGTSMSTPQVAAAAAIAKSVDRSIDINGFKQLLIDSCDDAGIPGYDNEYGYGKLNIQRLVEILTYQPLFSDTANHWAEEFISYCVERGLLVGQGDGFAPEGEMTRAMLVTVLHRMSGSPEVVMAEDAVLFSDVTDSEQWYYNAVYWAAQQGIVTGMDDGSFAPMSPITREQFAAIIYRAYGSPEVLEETLTSFPDAEQVHDYAINGLSWCVQQGIIGGSDGNLLPREGATRAQAAKIIAVYDALINAAIEGGETGETTVQ